MRNSGSNIDELADRIARFCERAQSEMLQLLQSRSAEKAVALLPDWMSAIQLAPYWQLHNENNEPTTAGILKWSKRPGNQFPLPDAYTVDLFRFNRHEADLWRSKKLKGERTVGKSLRGVAHAQGRAPAIRSLEVAPDVFKGLAQESERLIELLPMAGWEPSGNKSMIQTRGVDLLGN